MSLKHYLSKAKQHKLTASHSSLEGTLRFNNDLVADDEAIQDNKRANFCGLKRNILKNKKFSRAKSLTP